MTFSNLSVNLNGNIHLTHWFDSTYSYFFRQNARCDDRALNTINLPFTKYLS
jgi:hypothetical protein